MPETANQAWASQFRDELTENILPFWMRYAVDREQGGFYGLICNDLTVVKDAPKASIINSRALWTFSAALRMLGEEYRDTADRAYDAQTRGFWDSREGGLFWMLDHRGEPLDARKQIYAQAFGVYALSEYFRATGDAACLDLAKRLFWLIEDHGYDGDFGGYIEARDRDWGDLDDMRLSDKDLNCPKSMNTHLHVLEGYTNLLRVWRDPILESKLRELLLLMVDRIVDPATGHFRMFFDEQWNPISDHISFGHDIEGSWLIDEAAEVLGDPALAGRACSTALRTADAVYREGVDRDGSVVFEADRTGVIVKPARHWWVQAEAVIGFYNAFTLSHQPRYAVAARRAWDYIQAKVVDRAHGEWHAKLAPNGEPLTDKQDPDSHLVGPWKCPYHNARVCFEMMARLSTNGNEAP